MEPRGICLVEIVEDAGAQREGGGKFSRCGGHTGRIVHELTPNLWPAVAEIDGAFETAAIEVGVFFWNAHTAVVPVVANLVEEPVGSGMHLQPPVEPPFRLVEVVGSVMGAIE